MSTSLLKSIGRNSIADAVYKEISNRTTRFYHFFGRTSQWINDSTPPNISDSLVYEREVRNEIIAMKEIAPSDIAYVIPRIDWTSGTVYDEYDDFYSTEIIGIDISAGGSGYTSPTVTIGTMCPTNTSVSAGTQYYFVISGVGYLYTVIASGTTGISNTVLGGSIDTVYTHGTASLKCVGYQATASVSLGTGAYSSSIVSTTMINRGYGYTTTPTVTFSGGIGNGATGTAVRQVDTNLTYKLDTSNFYVLSGNNIYICISNNNDVVSTVAPTGVSSDIFSTADGYHWKYMSTVPSGSKFLTSYYMPVYTASAFQYNPLGSIVNVSIDSAGSNYTVGTTTISVSGDGSSASLSPQVTDGKISGVTINNAGTNYTYANITISSSSGGTGAALSASFDSGVIPDSAQALAESNVVAGTIINIPLISKGFAYTTASVSIVGDGTGATATANIVGGRISSITMTNRGSNYNWAIVTITGNGVAASARAIISPYNGLGRDPINQLFSNSLMMYSRIDQNTNQGVVVTNDYRQIGIIKDPLRYSDKLYLKSNFATSCWKVTATATITGISNDDIVTAYANSIPYKFRVEYVSGANVLLIPIDNGVPAGGMQFTKSTGSTFIASKAVAPSVDKYSGDLMIIDNETAFDGATTVVRTVINF